MQAHRGENGFAECDRDQHIPDEMGDAINSIVHPLSIASKTRKGHRGGAEKRIEDVRVQTSIADHLLQQQATLLQLLRSSKEASRQIEGLRKQVSLLCTRGFEAQGQTGSSEGSLSDPPGDNAHFNDMVGRKRDFEKIQMQQRGEPSGFGQNGGQEADAGDGALAAWDYFEIAAATNEKDHFERRATPRPEFSSPSAAELDFIHGVDSDRPARVITLTWFGRNYDLLKVVDMFSIWLVFLSTVIAAIQLNYNMDAHFRPDPDIPTVMTIIDTVITVLFTLEFSTRWYLMGRVFFTGHDKLFNIMDAVFVLNMVTDLVMTFVDLSILRILRVFRALRAFRALRGLRAIRELRFLIASIISSMCSLMWGLGLLFFALFIFATFVMQTLIIYADNNTVELSQGVKESYGTVQQSIYTLFMGISGGKDWDDLLTPLRDVSHVYQFMFLLYICVMLFGIMNVITAVFCENASHIAQVDKELVIQDEMRRQHEEKKQIKEFFSFVDSNEDGTMSAAELDSIINTRERSAMLGLLSIDAAEARCLFSMMDTDNTGTVEIDAYVDAILRLKGPAKGCDVAQLLYEHKRLLIRFASFLCYANECFESIFVALKVPEKAGEIAHFLDPDFIREHERASKYEINNGFVRQLGFGSAKSIQIGASKLENPAPAIRQAAKANVIERRNTRQVP